MNKESRTTLQISIGLFPISRQGNLSSRLRSETHHMLLSETLLMYARVDVYVQSKVDVPHAKMGRNKIGYEIMRCHQ